MTICTECGDDDDCRPYGKNFSMVCFSCGMSEKNREIVEQNFAIIFKSAVQNSKDGIIVVGEETGVRPMNPKNVH